MRIRSIALAGALAAAAAWPVLASSQAASQNRQTITKVFQEAIPNVPGKSLIGILVSYPPGSASRAHYHPRSAFIAAYVLSGSVRSQENNGPVRVYHAGEHWTEPPGSYHPISENASNTEPAKLLAIFVVDTADAARLLTYKRQ
jgi:quercetin dioxygenase-like cupin family protein